MGNPVDKYNFSQRFIRDPSEVRRSPIEEQTNQIGLGSLFLLNANSEKKEALEPERVQADPFEDLALSESNDSESESALDPETPLELPASLRGFELSEFEEEDNPSNPAAEGFATPSSKRRKIPHPPLAPKKPRISYAPHAQFFESRVDRPSSSFIITSKPELHFALEAPGQKEIGIFTPTTANEKLRDLCKITGYEIAGNSYVWNEEPITAIKQEPIDRPFSGIYCALMLAIDALTDMELLGKRDQFWNSVRYSGFLTGRSLVHTIRALEIPQLQPAISKLTTCKEAISTDPAELTVYRYAEDADEVLDYIETKIQETQKPVIVSITHHEPHIGSQWIIIDAFTETENGMRVVCIRDSLSGQFRYLPEEQIQQWFFNKIDTADIIYFPNPKNTPTI